MAQTKRTKNTLKSPNGYISQTEAAIRIGGSYSAVRKMIHEERIKDHGWWEGRHLVSEAEIDRISKVFKPRIQAGSVTSLPNGDFVVPITIKGIDYKILASAGSLKNLNPVEFISKLVQADAKNLRESMSSFLEEPFKGKQKRGNPMDKISKR